MTIFTLPPEDLRAATVRFWLRPISISSAQPWTGRRSVYGPTAQVWVAEISTTAMAEEQAERLGAFFARLGGIAGLVRLSNPVRRAPIRNGRNSGMTTGFSDGTAFDDGTGWTDGLVPAAAAIRDAAYAEDTSLVLTGLPANAVPCLLPGDLFEIRPNGIAAEHGHLYKAVANAPTDAVGETRVEVTPPLRKAVAAGDQVLFREPTSVFRAMDDEQGVVNWERGMIGRAGYTLVEELPD